MSIRGYKVFNNNEESKKTGKKFENKSRWNKDGE